MERTGEAQLVRAAVRIGIWAAIPVVSPLVVFALLQEHLGGMHLARMRDNTCRAGVSLTHV